VFASDKQTSSVAAVECCDVGASNLLIYSQISCLLRVKAYLQEPRDQWVQNWPGQVVLCVSQIYWTAHVHAALDGSGPTLAEFWNSLQVGEARRHLYELAEVETPHTRVTKPGGL